MSVLLREFLDYRWENIIKPTVISVTSGKGGVGKTLTTVNLAVAARSMGNEVLILDGDLGLANVDVVLGLQARYNINDILEGQASIQDIILTGPLGIRIIPSGSGISQLTTLSHVQRVQLWDQIDEFKERFDVLFVDTGAGISPSVVHFNACADDVVVVTTPEPHAMTDAYAMIKVIHENSHDKRINLLVNMARSETEAVKIFERIFDVTNRFLKFEIMYAGYVPLDPQVQKSVSIRRAASEDSTFTIAGQAWNRVTRQLLTERRSKDSVGSQKTVWKDLLWGDRQGGAVSI